MGQRPGAASGFLALSGANAYDAANVLFEGIRRAKSTDPQKIIQAIESIKNLQGVNAQYTFWRKGIMASVKTASACSNTPRWATRSN